MQLVAEEQETPARVGIPAGPMTGLGMVSAVQDLPFHTEEAMEVPLGPAPTATQVVEVGQETAVSVVSPVGDGSVAQDFPFHDSASPSLSARCTGPVTARPTATQLTGPEQEMASNRLDLAPAGLTGVS